MKQFHEREFSLFALAHSYWEKVLEPHDWAIDATCGNGHDTHFLAERCAGVISLDIQSQALASAKAKGEKENIFLFLQSHDTFPPLALQVPIKLIVYNLGYLPGSDKRLTTLTETTLTSVERALDLVLPGGLVSITCYPGHVEGAKEEEALFKFLTSLSPQIWTVCVHQWLNRHKAPSLIICSKNVKEL